MDPNSSYSVCLSMTEDHLSTNTYTKDYVKTEEDFLMFYLHKADPRQPVFFLTPSPLPSLY